MNATLTPHVAHIREHSIAMEPIPTGVKPVLRRMPDIKAVLFTVYGTLFVSATGELETIDDTVFDHALVDSLAAAGLSLDGTRLADSVMTRVRRTIITAREETTEAEVVKAWRTTLRDLRDEHVLTGDIDDVDIARLALDFEVRANPVWPMPGAQRCLTELSARGLSVGVVSNGPWFSPLLFPALMGGSLPTLGVAQDLQLWSFSTGEPKPGLTLFRRAKAVLAQRDITPDRVLFVGHDMLLDVMPAAQTGFRTALFAGDARSLRMRDEDPRVGGVEPDLVLLNVLDVVRCVRPGD